MAYRFILGGSGSGKTHWVFTNCIKESLQNPKRKYMIIVPEQYTLQTQKDMIALHPYHATTQIDVISFNRLAHKVFYECGIHHPQVLDDIGKTLILKKIALENRSKLKTWKHQLGKSGFIESLKSLISELYQYGLKEEKLEEVLKEKLPANLHSKLEDTQLLIQCFKKYIQERFITTEEILDILCKNIYKSQKIKNSYIIIDGFTGFTPIQFRILENLLIYAKNVEITVIVSDKREAYSKLQETDLFLMGKTFIKKIDEIAQKNAVLHQEDIECKIQYRFQNSYALAHLERYFLRFGFFRKIPVENTIEIIRANDIQEEIRFVTSQILRMVQKEGIRYRDIAIITGDLERYKEMISNRLYYLEIPYHIDDNISLEQNPLMEYIRAALRVVIEGYSYEAVMMYLKSNLKPRNQKLVWQLDLYMIESGIKSKKKFLREWTYLPKSLKGIDLADLMVLRDEIVEELAELEKSISNKKRYAGEIIQALQGLLERISAKERLQEMAETFAKDSTQQMRAREYMDVYEQLQELFVQMREVLEKEELGKREFLELLESGVSQLQVGMIPTYIDKIVVGDILRTRLSDIKVLFIMGANDGTLIRAKSSGAIFNDREKEKIKKFGLELSATIKEDIFIQRFYLYLACTRASKKLILSFPGMDSSGNALKESNLLHQICRLYQDLEILPVKQGEIYSVYEAKERLIAALRQMALGIEDEMLFQTLYYVKQADFLIEASHFIYQEKGLGKEIAKELFGKEILASATRLEQYVDCPYKHFLRYGLELHEVRAYGFENIDIGNLAHSMVEKVFVLAKKREQNIADMSDQERDILVEECIQAVLLEDEKGVYGDSYKNQYLVKRVIAMTKRILWVLAKQLEKGDFIPYALEKIFDSKEARESLGINLEDNMVMKLSGKIDRVDICQTKDRVLVKVIDYKTGNTKWEPDLTYYGKQMQLVLYLSAMEEILKGEEKGKEILPAAMFYIHMDDPLMDGSGLEGLEQKALKEKVDAMILKALKPSGLVNTDLSIIQHLDKSIEKASDVIPVALKNGEIASRGSSVASTERFRILQKYVQVKAKEIGERIIRGEIGIMPSNRLGKIACEYCPYLSVCGFDKKTEGFAYRNWKKLDTKEVWEKMEKEVEEEIDGSDME